MEDWELELYGVFEDDLEEEVNNNNNEAETEEVYSMCDCGNKMELLDQFSLYCDSCGFQKKAKKFNEKMVNYSCLPTIGANGHISLYFNGQRNENSVINSKIKSIKATLKLGDNDINIPNDILRKAAILTNDVTKALNITTKSDNKKSLWIESIYRTMLEDDRNIIISKDKLKLLLDVNCGSTEGFKLISKYYDMKGLTLNTGPLNIEATVHTICMLIDNFNNVDKLSFEALCVDFVERTVEKNISIETCMATKCLTAIIILAVEAKIPINKTILLENQDIKQSTITKSIRDIANYINDINDIINEAKYLKNGN